MKMLKNSFCLLTLVAVLGGCHSSSSSGPAEPNNGAQGGKDETLFRPALVLMIQGTYSGQCVSYPAGNPTTASVVISSDGQVKSPGATGSILGDGVSFTFSRIFSGGVPIAGSFTTSDLSQPSGLNLGLGSGGSTETNTVSARQGIGNTSGVACTASNETAVLKTKSLFASVSKFLIAPKKTVNCLVNGAAKSTDLVISNESVQVGGGTYSVTSGLKEEVVGVMSPDSNLVYSLKTDDNREFSITLDKAGAFSLLNYKDLQGATISCVP